MSAVCPCGDRYGRQQDDGVLLDEAEESSSNHFYRGRMLGGRRLLVESGNLVKNDVVAANGVRHHWRTLPVNPGLDGDRRVVEENGPGPLRVYRPGSSSIPNISDSVRSEAIPFFGSWFANGVGLAAGL